MNVCNNHQEDCSYMELLYIHSFFYTHVMWLENKS